MVGCPFLVDGIRGKGQPEVFFLFVPFSFLCVFFGFFIDSWRMEYTLGNQKEKRGKREDEGYEEKRQCMYYLHFFLMYKKN